MNIPRTRKHHSQTREILSFTLASTTLISLVRYFSQDLQCSLWPSFLLQTCEQNFCIVLILKLFIFVFNTHLILSFIRFNLNYFLSWKEY